MATVMELQKALRNSQDLLAAQGAVIDEVAEVLGLKLAESDQPYSAVELVIAAKAAVSNGGGYQVVPPVGSNGNGRMKEIMHIVRRIASLPGVEGLPATQINEYLGTFFAEGWGLFNTHVVSSPGSDGVSMLWILTR